MSQWDIQDKNYNLENSRTGDLYGQIQAEWSTFMARAMAVHVPGYKYLVNIRGMRANGNVSGRCRVQVWTTLRHTKEVPSTADI